MRILLADDEDILIEFLVKSFKLNKHIVDVAKNGTEAITKVSQEEYDVIVLDIIMPQKDGLTVCKELRSNGIQTPIILLTSRVDKKDRVQGLDAGADDYVTKPFSYEELEARIRAVTRRPKSVLPTIIETGPLSLDPAKKIITFGDDPLSLRPKEYKLLEYLMRHAGDVISKEELLKNVWRISSANASNRLEVCMYHIRQKVNKEKKLLKTVRGYGYVIEVQ